MARFFLCLAAAAACCCVALLVLPVQGRVGIGLAGGSGGREYLLPEPQFRAAEARDEEQRGATVKARPSWSSPSTAAAAGRARTELRSVPGGPDPMHHHGSPWRPELEQTTP